MTASQTLAERVTSCFNILTIAAAELNAVSDELGKSVAQIDFALKNLNLGMTVWVPIQSWSNEHFGELDFWSEDIGYAKNNGKWGICLRRVEGNHNDPDHHKTEEWLFGDAPRALRLLAIDKVPVLLEELSSKATSATSKIREKLADVQAVAAAVNPLFPVNRTRLYPPVGALPEGIGRAVLAEEQRLAAQGRDAIEKAQNEILAKSKGAKK